MSTYKIDPAHSEITFKIRHLMISNVTGSFKKFDATMESNAADFSDANITFEADVDSVDTGNAQRDGHLKADDFFAAGKFPKIKFQSTAFVKKNDSEYQLNGHLTIRDRTNPVQLAVEYGGGMKDFYGQDKTGFELSGTINRKDFGLSWGGVTETGGVVLGDDIKLNMSVQMIKQA